MHCTNALCLSTLAEVSLINSLCPACILFVKTLNFSIHIQQFFSSVNAGIVYFEKVIRVVKRSGLCRNDLIEVVEVALAQ